MLLENTRKKVITIETSDGSVPGLTSEQAIAMSGTTLGIAGTGGEGWGSPQDCALALRVDTSAAGPGV